MTLSKAALFDLDGVVLDTEPLYTTFWDEQGLNYLGIENFCKGIKGQSLKQIFDGYFKDLPIVQEEITNALNKFEAEMPFQNIPGVFSFIKDLKLHDVKIALVTSSNQLKMEKVYQALPTFKSLFDVILTGDMYGRSKPAPDCFLKSMEMLQVKAKDAVVFEDSLHGLEAGRLSGAYVVGLATTNPAEAIRDKANAVIDNFNEITYKTFVSWFNNTFM